MLSVTVRKDLPGFSLDLTWSCPSAVVALFGPSGSGKSLTLQCIAGLVDPDQGRITLDDKVYLDTERGVNLPARARRVGYVFQGYALFPHLTVEQNVAYGLRHHARPARKRRVDEMLTRLNLQEYRRARPAALSGGQQQRVALGRALAGEPALLLLDEPLSALDAPLRRQLRTELLGTIRDFGLTTVIVTHDLGEAFHLADHVVVYNRGRVVQSSRKADVLTAPASADVARLLGVRNLLTGRIVAESETMTTLDWAGHHLQAARLPSRGAHAGIGGQIAFFVRPEHIRLVRKDRPAPAATRLNVLAGQVVEEIDLGTTINMRFEVDSGRDGAAADAILEIDVPLLVYEMLDIRRDRRWEVAIQPSAVHLLP